MSNFLYKLVYLKSAIEIENVTWVEYYSQIEIT